MDARAGAPDDFAGIFETAFARLQILIEEACAASEDWPAGVAAAIRASFGFAAADPAAAGALTSEALAAGPDGFARHRRLIAYLAEGLAPGRDLRVEGSELPSVTEQALAAGLASLVAERLDRDRIAELPGLAPEAIQFALTPYVGVEEAKRVAAGWPGSQPDR